MNKTLITQLENLIHELEAFRDALAQVLQTPQGLETIAPKRKPGRPKGSKNKGATPVVEPPPPREIDPSLVAEAATMEGTDPALAERIKNRYRPFPRAGESRGPGIRAGDKAQVMDRPAGKGHQSVDDTIEDPYDGKSQMRKL